MIAKRLRFAAFATSLVSIVSAQTFQRLGTCPTLGCILPPDAQDFLAGQYFDIRLEIHAPVNGSEATDGMHCPVDLSPIDLPLPNVRTAAAFLLT